MSPNLLRTIRRELETVIDLERAIQRSSLGKSSPRDLRSLARTLLTIKSIGESFLNDKPLKLPIIVQNWITAITSNMELYNFADLICQSI